MPDHEKFTYRDFGPANMPSIYQIKPAFQGILRPWVANLRQLGITPNQITVLAVILSGLMGGLIAAYPQQRLVLGAVPLCLLVRMALNAMDGILAKEFDLKSKLGQLLNELGDVISDTLLYLPFARIPGIAALWIVPIVILAILTEMTGVLGVTTGSHRSYAGPMGKSDRAFIMGALALLFACGVSPGPWLTFVWIALIVLLVWTIINRAIDALQDSSHALDSPST